VASDLIFSINRISFALSDIWKRSLEQEKLLMTGWAALIGSSFWPLGLLLFGISLFIASRASAPPDLQVFALPFRWIGIVILCCVPPGLHTRWGRRILEEIHRTHDPFDVIQRFALFGYPQLSGGVFDDLRQAFTAEEQEAARGGCGCGC